MVRNTAHSARIFHLREWISISFMFGVAPMIPIYLFFLNGAYDTNYQDTLNRQGIVSY